MYTISEIKALCHAQLTGNTQEDVAFLEKQARKYSKEENGAEIAKALSEMAFSLLPQDEQDKLKKLCYIDDKRMDQIFAEADALLKQKDFIKAEALLKQLSDKIAEDFEGENAEQRYFSFRNPFEYHTYLEFYATSKEFGRAPFDFSLFLLVYGFTLIELHQYEEAEQVLERAIRFNPVNPDAKFELGELFKLRKEPEKLLAQTRENMKFACSSYILARGYSDMGFYCMEKGEYREALCFYYCSLFFVENKSVRYELRDAEIRCGRDNAGAPTRAEIEKLCAKYEVADGPNIKVVALATTLAESAEQQKRFDLAAYFCRIAFDLTREEAFKDRYLKLDEIHKKELEKAAKAEEE